MAERLINIRKTKQLQVFANKTYKNININVEIIVRINWKHVLYPYSRDVHPVARVIKSQDKTLVRNNP
jgi:hypothetical protein